jgi:hypothetical protein
VQDQDSIARRPAESVSAAESPPAASAADALADAVLERRRAEFKSSLPRLLTALFDPLPPAPARSISRQRW